MSGKRPRIPPEEYAAYLRQMARQQRELAEEFDRRAERAERAAVFGKLGEGMLEADLGHTFRISFESRGSYKVTGDEHHHDAPDFDGIVHSVEVRAWNLRDALSKAAGLPFNVLMGDDEHKEDS